MNGSPNDRHERETALARRRYDRIAPVYDLAEWFMELRASGWRQQLWSLVEGQHVLEIGVGTGASLRHHPRRKQIVAIDISERMLTRARWKAERLGVESTLMLADAQDLPFADNSFDTVISSFVFCSVPDPLLGLREARRVLRPGGRLLLLEHVLSRLPVLRTLMRWLDPITSRVSGAHINRATVATVEAAGFVDIEAIDRSLDIVKQIGHLDRDDRPTISGSAEHLVILAGHGLRKPPLVTDPRDRGRCAEVRDDRVAIGDADALVDE